MDPLVHDLSDAGSVEFELTNVYSDGTIALTLKGGDASMYAFAQPTSDSSNTEIRFEFPDEYPGVCLP